MKKTIKKISRGIQINFNLYVLLIGLLITFFGLFLLYVLGFHSFDMMQNLEFIMCDAKITMLEDGIEWNQDYFETKVSGETISFKDMYREGIGNFLNGIIMTMIGMFFIGYGAGKLEK